MGSDAKVTENIFQKWILISSPNLVNAVAPESVNGTDIVYHRRFTVLVCPSISGLAVSLDSTT